MSWTEGLLKSSLPKGALNFNILDRLRGAFRPVFRGAA